MKKSESLVATLLAIYAILLTISIALYAVIKEFNIDIALSTNLLIWTATLFAPIAVLMTYTSWYHQKGLEVIALQAKSLIFDIKEVRKLGTNIIAQIVSLHLGKSDNSIVKKFIPIPQESEIKALIIQLNTMHNNIKPKIAFLKFSHDSELSILIEKYLEYVQVLNKYLYFNDSYEIETLFYEVKFNEDMSALLEELYCYALFQKKIGIGKI
ncbi:hypothetical protein G9F31_13560 [Acinetobacter sp. 187]|uniref:hypothetical protein n=1 Tax=Acinetobacter lanii TaxID=2715163 RepID=UPI00140E2CD2|nr:hypothetical protein [Acinetobacter lanii]NHC04773.1 hypothetical protein [Acinetobacter lanii]